MTALVGGTGIGAAAAGNTEVHEIVTASGVRAYLVTDTTLPFLSMTLQFQAGAVYDPPGREGLAAMLAGLLDEGADDLDSQSFHAALEDNAIRLAFEADRDGLTGSLKTLNATRELAFSLLRKALSAPRFDPEPLQRVRSQMIADIKRRETNPGYIASRTWFERALPGHPYGRPPNGSLASLEILGLADLTGYVQDRLGRSNLSIGVAGDITPDELAELLEATFAGLPGSVVLPEVAAARPVVGDTVVVEMPLPQSVVNFGHAGIDRRDPDYYAAHVVNYVLGGGGFSSRLMQEVRETRGLAYSVNSHLYDLRFSPLWLGGVATRNDQVAQSIAIVRAETTRMAEGAFSQEDLVNARTYLTGSFPLRLTSNDQIARMLVAMMAFDLGRDYLVTRNSLIEAVTLDDARRAAARLLEGELLVTIVGSPQGIDA